ncbi:MULTISPECIES: membrane metalloprotease [Flavobacterium]|uniref:Membrane metalloprotease n=1 Tax=Flavobacterium gawalongense TaxID=2594432 RepID=A0A553BPK1_9FLAO|nr:membrane metalloprotease [Flavobacterium gawalongense]TRX01552.1 membrane metalloprotease [Flavobacterium gawalongense]TRX06097.1 membrane metalloprotease [Flavobacterium gawalongense]TRX10148.1 membrane metalloprotease [Flavobacterium gawalongense]TRX11161.1 membrane metalloprotease [Flavobacterium gawalongense]TRX28810.1 membrane metalloprotease [Flavobacterium gawalongense]
MKKVIAALTIGLFLLVSCSKDDAIDNSETINPVTNKQTTGSSSNDLLSDKKFTSMVIEVVYVVGFEPSATAINNFVSFLDTRTYKPNGISIVKRAIPSPGKATFTDQEIVAIEDANRTKYNTSNQIAVWVFFSDGKSSSDTSTSVILGTAYRNTSLVIYEQTVQGLSDSPFEPNRSLLETTVITHELGHILGLTNLGTALQSNHEDTTHPKHCNVESCLMYWSSETGKGIENMVSGGSAPQLDAQCIADLRANGGK